MANAAKDPAVRDQDPIEHPLRGLLVTQFFGSFNDNAWKQIVALLAITSAASDQAAQGGAALAQVALIAPLMLVSMPAGVLADRVSKRAVILATKWFELALLLVGSIVLYLQPAGGRPSLAILMLLGIQAALFSPAKYGILPELLPYERLSAGNGLLELWSNLAIIMGTVAGGVLLWIAGDHAWMAGMVLVALSIIGLIASMSVPRVPAARAGGGLGETVTLAWSAIRGDRILRLAILGQIFIWTVASVFPAPILAYSKRTLVLADWQAGLPLAALGLGIGAGSVLAAKLSGVRVEYGLIPVGALGLSVTTLVFALLGPGLVVTFGLMGVVGLFTGLVFVPLNTLIQWHAPADRRGAVIAFANTLVFGGMLGGSVLALALAGAGITARGTCLGIALTLFAFFLWTSWHFPDRFLRCLVLMITATFYRIKVVGESNVPREGGALLTPNHASFADSLILIASIDRPVRFLVYDDYFRLPILSLLMRAMGTIPISSSGGPKPILQAFREAGRVLDEGHLVCLFPEGQITRTGMLLPFQRGMRRILKGRNSPIIPIHLDRVSASVFSPTHARLMPDRIPLPITVSFGPPMPSDTPLYRVRQVISDLNQEAWAYRKPDRRPLHHAFLRTWRWHPFRLALADARQPRVSGLGAIAGAIALARSLRPRWEGQSHVGLLLPASVAATLVNIAASIGGRISVNLNFTAGRPGMESAARRAGLRTVVTSRAFLKQAKIELPGGVEPIWIEDVVAASGTVSRLAAVALAVLAPVRLLERIAGATHRPTMDDTVTVIFTSGSTGEPKGVVLSHFNIDSNIEAILQVFRVQRGDRLLGILPLFHSFGYISLWLAANHGIGTIAHSSPLDTAIIGGLVNRYKATILLATPTFLQLYMHRCEPSQFGSLRVVLAGAEKMPDRLAESFEERFGIRPLEGYGVTECSPVIAVSTLDYRAPGYYQPGSRRGYIGQALPGISVRVVQPETFQWLEPGQEGMLLVKGPNVMQGYLGRDSLTASVLRDGWYITGDIALLDDDGFLKVVGRVSRFSKIGGEMVPHGRVEEALNQAVGAESPVFAVTAVTDAREEEQLAVLHTLDEKQVNEALARVSSSGLPNLFLPRRDHFIKVDAIPILGTGKPDLQAIKRTAEEALKHPRRDGDGKVTPGPPAVIHADSSSGSPGPRDPLGMDCSTAVEDSRRTSP